MINFKEVPHESGRCSWALSGSGSKYELLACFDLPGELDARDICRSQEMVHAAAAEASVVLYAAHRTAFVVEVSRHPHIDGELGPFSQVMRISIISLNFSVEEGALFHTIASLATHLNEVPVHYMVRGVRLREEVEEDDHVIHRKLYNTLN